MNAYWRESPVFQSLITFQLLISPNLLKIASKSDSCVTGFNFQTNRTFFGGWISASGKSPSISSTWAWDLAIFFWVYWLISSSVPPSVNASNLF